MELRCRGGGGGGGTGENGWADGPEDHEGAHAGGDGEADVDEHGHQLGDEVRQRVLLFVLWCVGGKGRSVSTCVWPSINLSIYVCGTIEK